MHPPIHKIILVLLGLQLSACTDPLNHSDSITLGAGNAIEANTALQTAYEDPPNVNNTDV